MATRETPTGTTIHWSGIGAPSQFEGIQSTTVNPDAQLASEGAPEWLVTNGLGGYASGTMSGLVTRRFHGYLVAALPAPRGRTMMLNHLNELISAGDECLRLSDQPDPERSKAPIARLREFRLELGIPVWLFEFAGGLFEKRIVMPHRQNTVFIMYTLVKGGKAPLMLELEPWLHFRPHEGTLAGPIVGDYALRAIGDRYEIENIRDVGLPPLRMKVAGGDARFWNEGAGALFDVVDGEAGNDAAIRPNQIFAISLPHPVLDPARWESVIEVVRTQLLTPYGLRTLAPGHRDYQPKYFGDLRARDLAYHQGTVWPWLIGPYFDAWRRVHPDRLQELRPVAENLGRHLATACIGSISEIFDAEAPYTPRGCCAQAWSVAEVIRVLASVPRESKGSAG